MTNETEQESNESNQGKNLLQRLYSLITFKKPGTKKELENEIHELLEEGEEHGLISSLEEKMITSILEFRDICASEIMTPAAEIVSFDQAQPMAQLIELVIESGFTRIPVFKDNPDIIIGAIHAKDLLKLCAHPDVESNEITSYVRPVYFIPESKPIVDLLREFQKRKLHIAMVTDEFGAVRGLITLEDILEEIVGEIDDEYDEEEKDLEILDDNSIQVNGWIDIEKIEEYFDISLTDGPYESVGGIVIHNLGRLAEKGDSIIINDLHFEVIDANTRQIKLIKISTIDRDDH